MVDRGVTVSKSKSIVDITSLQIEFKKNTKNNHTGKAGHKLDL